jgi:hypothetical protein
MQECQICYEERDCRVCTFGHAVCKECGSGSACIFCQPLTYTPMMGPGELSVESRQSGGAVALSVLVWLAAGMVTFKTLAWMLLGSQPPQWVTYSDPVWWHWVVEALAGAFFIGYVAYLRRRWAP